MAVNNENCVNLASNNTESSPSNPNGDNPPAMADDKSTTANKNTLKYVSLITLTLQNAILGLSMRYGRTRVDKDDLFYSSTGKAIRMGHPFTIHYYYIILQSHELSTKTHFLFISFFMCVCVCVV